MKIAATKVFADYINSIAKQTGKKFHAEIYKMSETVYNLTIDSLFTAAEYGDITKDRKVKLLLISYPAEYYAPHKYLTTYYLTKEFRRRNVKTAAELQDMILDLCEV